MGDLGPLVVKPREACKMLSCSHKKLYQLLADGELESFKDGRSRKITVTSIKRRIASQVASARPTLKRPAINPAVPDLLRSSASRYPSRLQENETRSTTFEKAAVVNRLRSERIEGDPGGGQADFHAEAFEPECVPPNAVFRYREPRPAISCPLGPVREPICTPGSSWFACRDHPCPGRNEGRLSLGDRDRHQKLLSELRREQDRKFDSHSQEGGGAGPAGWRRYCPVFPAWFVCDQVETPNSTCSRVADRRSDRITRAPSSTPRLWRAIYGRTTAPA
ncbi:MAG TPA: helix-turn-helix domain-containing protein [Xanthobacteraceae bacterium]